MSSGLLLIKRLWGPGNSTQPPTGPTDWIYCLNRDCSTQHLLSFCTLDAEPLLMDAHGWWVLHLYWAMLCTWLSKSVTHMQQHWSVMEQWSLNMCLSLGTPQSQLQTQNLEVNVILKPAADSNLLVNVILEQCLNGEDLLCAADSVPGIYLPCGRFQARWPPEIGYTFANGALSQ